MSEITESMLGELESVASGYNSDSANSELSSFGCGCTDECAKSCAGDCEGGCEGDCYTRHEG